MASGMPMARILAVIDEVLTALGLECDVASCLVEVRRLLKSSTYGLVLLDCEIPVRRGGVSRIQNAENFLEDLAERKAEGIPPVVILLPPESDCPMTREEAVRWASGVIRKGATDFIAKPFAKGGRTLDRVIKKVLRAKPKRQKVEPPPFIIQLPCDATPDGQCPKKAQPNPGPPAAEPPKREPRPAKPQAFAGGELVFHPDRVELCGVKILGAAAAASRAMLEVLAKAGRGRALSAEQIKRKIGADTVGTVTGAARTIRRNATEHLKRELNVESGKQDVLANDGYQGYRLKAWITVRWIDEESQRVRA
jgi:DNA-binding response OmpR family regulator